MRLLRSEFLRARSRRLVPMLIVAGLVGIVVALGIAAFTVERPTDAEVATAQARYAKNLDRCLSSDYTHDGGFVPSTQYASAEEYCQRTSGPSVTGVQLRDLDVIVQGISTFVVLLGVVLGTSLGGADWTNNTMTTLLTWEPRRARVFFTRALVVAVTVGAITAFLQVVFSAVYALVAAAVGTTLFLPSHFWTDVATTIGRVSVMAMALGLVGYVLAMIGRSTVSSLGALFGYLILFEGVIAGFRPTIQGNLLVRAASVVVSQQPIVDPTRELVSSGSGVSVAATPAILMDVQRAWTVVVVYVVVLGAISLVQYQRRDVT
jgi:ABC-2 type transport system permease protein